MKRFLILNPGKCYIHIIILLGKIKATVCSIKLLKPLFFNKSEDEKNSILASAFSITLFEISTLLQIIKSKKLQLPYILLSFAMLLFPISFFTLSRVYEFILLRNPDFILYPFKKGDTINLLSKKFFPECNPEKVCKIIISKNNLLKPPSAGDLILIPIKKEGKTLKNLSFINIFLKQS